MFNLSNLSWANVTVGIEFSDDFGVADVIVCEEIGKLFIARQVISLVLRPDHCGHFCSMLYVQGNFRWS